MRLKAFGGSKKPTEALPLEPLPPVAMTTPASRRNGQSEWGNQNSIVKLTAAKLHGLVDKLLSIVLGAGLSSAIAEAVHEVGLGAETLVVILGAAKLLSLVGAHHPVRAIFLLSMSEVCRSSLIARTAVKRTRHWPREFWAATVATRALRAKTAVFILTIGLLITTKW